METKRPLSPSACTHDQLVKRLRMSDEAAVKMPHRACIHCGSSQHNWVQCTSMCNHFRDVRSGKRCPTLGIEHYTPGGFNTRTFTTSTLPLRPARDTIAAHGSPDVTDTVIYPTHAGGHSPLQSIGAPGSVDPQASTAASVSQSNCTVTPVHFNPDRAAMIATTPAPEPLELEFDPARGPKRSGTNTLPLGRKGNQTASWSGSSRRTHKHERKNEQETWAALHLHINAAVKDTAKPRHGITDRGVVDDSVQRALDILRPIILGNVLQKQAVQGFAILDYGEDMAPNAKKEE